MTTKLYLSWEDFHSHVKAMAAKVKDSGVSYNKIVAVSRGGLLPAGILAYETGIRQCESINIASYDENTQRAETDIEIADSNLEADERTLIVDDISDSGRTFRILRELYPQACYAAVYVKPKGKDVADIFAFELPDEWVVFPWDNV